MYFNGPNTSLKRFLKHQCYFSIFNKIVVRKCKILVEVIIKVHWTFLAVPSLYTLETKFGNFVTKRVGEGLSSTPRLYPSFWATGKASHAIFGLRSRERYCRLCIRLVPSCTYVSTTDCTHLACSKKCSWHVPDNRFFRLHILRIVAVSTQQLRASTEIKWQNMNCCQYAGSIYFNITNCMAAI